MAKITPSTNEKLASIKVFGGLHESPDGDNKLKNGEAVKCTNFKVTNNGNLMKRFGTALKWTLGTDKPVRGMWHGWCSKRDLFIAACDGHLWMLMDNKVNQYPVDLAIYNTDNDVFMFGFDEKVFVMNGSVYGQIYFDGIPVAASAVATVSGSITAATVAVATFATKFDDSGTYTFYYGDNGWAYGFSDLVTLSDYGISVTGTAAVGDKITVFYNEALDGTWHFENLSDGQHGYRPLVATGIPAGGGGTLLEEVNKLNGMRRVWITGDASGVSFKLPEKAHTVSKIIDNRDQSEITEFSFTADTDTVVFDNAPPAIINVYEIQYEVSVNFASTVGAMRYAELYAGTQDSRVFIYGDGSNRTFYSSIDYLGHPRGDYFPDLYEVTVGDTNTPITGMIRHYTKMLAFKPTETFSIDYGVVTLADGLMSPSFYTTPVNKNAGNQAVGQVQLVLNAPRTLCQGNLYEWRNGSAYSANLSIDERQAKRISDRIYDTLQKMDFSKCHCYDDNLNTEYYIFDGDGNALVHNYFVDAWYYYSGFDARMAVAIDGDLYIGTHHGQVMLLDEKKTSDNGSPIECYWESGSMDFGAPNMRKYSSTLWVAVNADSKNAISVTVKTDRSEDNTEIDLEPEIEFDMPKISKLKVKVKKFVFYKLIFKSNDAQHRATVIDTEIKVRVTSQAK